MILFVVLHILVCCFLVLVVLLQSGKAGDLASTFGGGSSSSAFGTRSATTLLTKLTAVSAGLFMATCLILAGLARRGESSVMEGAAPNTPAATEAPAELEATPPPTEESSEAPTGGN